MHLFMASVLLRAAWLNVVREQFPSSSTQVKLRQAEQHRAFRSGMVPVEPADSTKERIGAVFTIGRSFLLR
jgi:hypothetical protein